jgi:hypothetical protein
VITHGLSGKFADVVVFSQRNGRTIASRVPGKRTGPMTAGQLAVQAKFQKAVAYARSVMEDPSNREAYLKKARPGQTAFNMAIADYFKGPEIHEMDHSGYSGNIGEKILVRVSDNFRVREVKLSIQKTGRKHTGRGKCHHAAE